MIKDCHLKLEIMDQEVADARERLKAKFGKQTQIGGKGKLHLRSGGDWQLNLLTSCRYSEKGEESCAHSTVSFGRRQEAQGRNQEIR